MSPRYAIGTNAFAREAENAEPRLTDDGVEPTSGDLAPALRALRLAAGAAQRYANRARTAPDAVALFYDLARVDDELVQIRSALARLDYEIRRLRPTSR